SSRTSGRCRKPSAAASARPPQKRRLRWRNRSVTRRRRSRPRSTGAASTVGWGSEIPESWTGSLRTRTWSTASPRVRDDGAAWGPRHLAAQRLATASRAARRPFGPDGRILYRGEGHRLRLERAAPGTKRSRVLRVGGDELDEIVLVLALHDSRPAAKVLEDWLRERAQSAIRSEIAAYAQALSVRPTAVSVRDARTRWGSATRTGRLSFSWRLILAPPAALETVVIHELAHLRVFGHGPRFWA